MALLLPSAVAAEDRPWWAGRLRAGTGLEFSRGDFGASATTDSWFVPLSLKVAFEELGITEGDEIELRVALPYSVIDGPGSRQQEVSPDNLGNLSLTAGYSFVPESRHVPVMRLRTRVKLPVTLGDEDVGSDQTDVTVSGDLFQTFRIRGDRYPRVIAFADLGYRIAEDGPDGTRKDGPRAGFGGGLRLNRLLALTADYAWHTSTDPHARDVHSVTGGFSVRLPLGFRVAPYASAGLSRSAPDWALGVSLSATVRFE